ncbi:MAG: hypothetical protein ACLSE7_07090 [Lachnospirales bacterium]
MSVIDTLVTNRTAGVCYNASDLNRVGSAVQYVAGILSGYGYTVPVTGRTNWAVGEIPTQADMSAYLADLTALRGAVAVMSTTPAVPGSMSLLTYQEANDIEKILQDVDELITKMAAAWFYCGEVYTGEV